MKILFGLLFSVIFLSQGNAQNLRQQILDEGFKIAMSDDAEVLRLSEIKRIKTFQDQFWRMDSLIEDFRFILPFDFNEGRIDKKSQYGIPVEGLPLTPVYLKMHWVKVLLHSKRDFELHVDEGGLKATIEKNILNDEGIPYLAENPKLAYTEIRVPNRLKIKKTELILSKITDVYLDLIERKISEENLEVKEALEKYPLKIMLTQLVKPPKMKEKEIIEIEEAIEEDFEN